MKGIIFLVDIFLIGAVLFGCAPGTEKPVLPETLTPETPSLTKEAWQTEWERTFSLARREGVVHISAGPAGTNLTREIFRSSFTEKYGIELIWTVGMGGEISQKIVTERRAGLYTTDISITGGNTSISVYKVYGFLQPLKPSMILPEVKDESAWLGGKLPFIDSEGMYVLAATLYPQAPLYINTRLVKEDEFSTYANLLNPKWKGKFIAADFTVTGGGLKWFSAMIEEDFGPILGLDYMRALSQQDPIIVRDKRITAEWLIREKYPFGLNSQITDDLAAFRREGIPIPPLKGVTPKEGGYITTGSQVITYFDKAPHPNASRVFLNWLLSREGAIALIKATVKDSSRIDISAGEIDPQAAIREPGKSYVNTDQEKFLLKTNEYVRLAREIFGHLLR